MDQETVDEMKRHFGVVAEDMRSEIRVVAEGQQLLAEEMRVGFQQVDRRFTKVDCQFDEVRKELQETRAMVHLSYVEVDRRLRDLERGR